VHLSASFPPTVAISQIMYRLKRATAHQLRKEFPHLKSRLPSLWMRSYYVGTAGHVSAHDAGLAEFRQLLAYKAERAGKILVKIDPKYASQKCSRCERIVEKTLAERVHKCSHCGLEMDRDYNAALNILRIGQELSEYTPVETEPLCTPDLKVQSMKQEAHYFSGG